MDRMTLAVSLSPEDFENNCAGGECWHCKECRNEAVRHDASCSVGKRMVALFPQHFVVSDYGCWIK